MKRKLVVHIERLIIDGIAIPQRQRPQVVAALESELARMLAADGLAVDLAMGGAYPRVSAGSIQLQSECEASLLGRQIAQAVYKGIGATEGRTNG